MALRDQIPSEWSGQPNIEGMVDAFDTAGARVDTDVDARVAEFQIDTATEAELDEYLRLVGPSRAQLDAAIRANTTAGDPLTLALYRNIVRGAGAASRSPGSIESMYRAWLAIEPTQGCSIETPFTAGAIAFNYGAPGFSLDPTIDTGDADLDESYLAAVELIINGAAPIGTVATLADGSLIAMSPDHAWTMQEASAPTDQIGAADFSVTDTAPDYQQTPGEDGRFFVAFTPIDDYLTATLPDLATGEKLTIWARVRVSKPSVSTGSFLDGDNASNNWAVEIDTSGHVTLVVNDDAGDKTATIAVDHDAQWINVVIVVDNTTSATQKIWTSLGSATVALGTTTSSMGTELRLRTTNSFISLDVGFLAAWDSAITDAQAARLAAFSP